MHIITILYKYSLLQMYIIVTQKDDPDALIQVCTLTLIPQLKTVPEDKSGL